MRLFAATSLRNIVVSPLGEHVLRPHLQSLVTELLRLMNSVESDDLVLTLDVIIENYGEEVVPFAVNLITHLAGYFMKKVDEDDPQDENDTIAVTCMEVLSAIGTVRQ